MNPIPMPTDPEELSALIAKAKEHVAKGGRIVFTHDSETPKGSISFEHTGEDKE